MRQLRFPVHQPRMLQEPDARGRVIDGRLYFLGVALVVAGILLHQPLLVVIALLLLLVLGTTDIWARFCLLNLQYRRQFSEQRVLFGEEIALSLTVENAKILPLPWLEVTEAMPRALPLKEQELRSSSTSNTAALECLFSPGWYERVTRRYTVRCNQRGVHTFGPTTLRSGDVFGFTDQHIELSNQQYVLVYPLVVPLTRFGLPARHPFGERRAPRRLLEDPARVIGVRDYHYGDSLRRIHWKATARTMQLQSKVYEATTTYTLVIFLNVESHLDQYYGFHAEWLELSICAAASIASWAFDNDYAVALYSNTIMFIPDEDVAVAHEPGAERDLAATMVAQLRRRRISLPVASSKEQRKHILEALARIQGFFGTSIEDIIQAERFHLPAGATIVLITSTMSERLVERLVQLRKGGHAVTILFVGDTPAPTRIAGITTYHLGGEAMWKDLEASYSNPPNEVEQSLQGVAGFRL